MANFHKFNKSYYKAIKLYKQLIDIEGENNKLLFLYASCLDKIGSWAESEKILLRIINNDNYKNIERIETKLRSLKAERGNFIKSFKAYNY